MKEKIIDFVIVLIFILIPILGTFLFIVNVDWEASFSTLEDKVFMLGLGVSIGGSLLLWLLLKVGEKIKFLNKFLENPPVKKAIECLGKIFIFIWLVLFLWGLIGMLTGRINFG